MALEKIMAITGKPGLYKLVAQTRSGFVAESLENGKRMSIGLRNNVSLLSEIAIYTLTEEIPLRKVFETIKEKEEGKEASVAPKAAKEDLEAYFFDILPDYDEDRVYPSDIKKVIQWYNLLVKSGMDDFSESETEEVEDSVKEQE